MPPIRKVEYVDQPLVMKRYTPNNAAMAALRVRQGENLADLSLQRGANTAQLFDRLGAIFSGYQEMEQAKRATAVAMGQREKERGEDRAERERDRESDRAAKAEERRQMQLERDAIQAERRGAAVAEEVGYGPMSEQQMTDVLPGPAGGRARYVFGPGTAEGPELQPTKQQAAQAQSIKEIEAMGGKVGPNGQVIMPPKPTATKSLKMEPAMVNGRRTFVVFDPETGEARDFRGQPVDAQPIPPASATPSDNQPLVPIVGTDGKTRYGTRQEARGQLVPAGSNKPATGLEKRALNFFNRAEQADKDLETMEAEIQKLGLFDQTRMAVAPNWAQSQQGQLYTQAQRAFTEARLRKDSGAAIPPAEFENDRKTYFAEPGDSAQTLEQKRRARATMLASLAFESGQALGEFVGDPEEAAKIIQSYKTRAQRQAPKADPIDALIEKYRKPGGGQ